ncbi:MAG: hypothetical protein AB9861_19610 [Methanosarcina sp.]
MSGIPVLKHVADLFQNPSRSVLQLRLSILCPLSFGKGLRTAAFLSSLTCILSGGWALRGAT